MRPPQWMATDPGLLKNVWLKSTADVLRWAETPDEAIQILWAALKQVSEQNERYCAAEFQRMLREPGPLVGL